MMDKEASEDTQETAREQHSLPGTNMAGKGPGDECEPRDKRDGSRGQGDQATQVPDHQGADTSTE